MFKDNKYTNTYYKIIERAKDRKLNGYGENHHIIPKCLGGSNNKSNIVRLTAREHFLVHLLLTKMNDSNGLKFALFRMMYPNNEYQDSRYIINSVLYEKIKILHSNACRVRNSNRSYKRGHVNAVSPDMKLKQFNSEKEIPEGQVRTNLQKGKTLVSSIGKYYYHQETGVIKNVRPHEMVPEGFVKGNPAALKASEKGRLKIKGTSYYHNPVSGEEIRSFTCPAGFLKGRSMRQSTDGIQNIQRNLIDTLPKGFWQGRTTKTGHKQNRKSK